MTQRARANAAANRTRIADHRRSDAEEQQQLERDQKGFDPPGRRSFYPPHAGATRRTSESFSARDRELLYLLNARAHGGVATCELCGRAPLRLYGPPGDDKMVAGHITPRSAGGQPVLENGRAECARCSHAEGRRLLGQAMAAARERRRNWQTRAPGRVLF